MDERLAELERLGEAAHMGSVMVTRWGGPEHRGMHYSVDDAFFVASANACRPGGWLVAEVRRLREGNALLTQAAQNTHPGCGDWSIYGDEIFIDGIGGLKVGSAERMAAAEIDRENAEADNRRLRDRLAATRAWMNQAIDFLPPNDPDIPEGAVLLADAAELLAETEEGK